MKPRTTTARRSSWVEFARVGVAPALIFVSHFFYGAALPVPALVLLASLLAVLAGLLASSDARRRLDEMSPAWTLAVLFGAVLLAALASLTPWVAGGAHPIWVWSGGAPASTLDRSATVIEILKLVGLAAPFLIGSVLGLRSDHGRTLYGAILGLGGIYALISLVVFLGEAAMGTSGARLSGGFESANIAGALFGVLSMMAFAWMFRSWRRTEGASLTDRTGSIAPVLAVAILFILCLLLTASRGALAATGLALALFLGWAAMDNRKARVTMIVAGAVVVSAAAIVYLRGNTLFADRFLDVGTDTTRADLLAPHWRAFLKAPLFGYGLGSWSEVNNQIMTSRNFDALATTVILHNAYVQWLEEAGIVGSAPMALLLLVILGSTAWRAWRRSRNRALIIGLLLSSLIVLLHATVDVSLNTPSFCAFWSLLLGLGFGLSQASSRS